MERMELKTGEILHAGPEIVKQLDYILSGSVEITSGAFRVTAGEAVVLGLFEHIGEAYRCVYTAKEDCVIERYPFRRKSDVDAIVQDHAGECDLLVSSGAAMTLGILGQYQRTRRRTESLRRTLVRSYGEYRDLCNRYGLEIQPWPLAEDCEPFRPERELPDWLGDYYDQLGLMPTEVKKAFYSTHTSLTTAAILDAVNHIFLILRLSDQLESYTAELRERYLQSADLYDLYLNLCTGNGSVSAAQAAEISAALQAYHNALLRSGLLPEAHLNARLLRYENAVSALSASLPAQAAGSLPDITADPTAALAEALLTEVHTPLEVPAEPDPFAPLEGSLETILAYTAPEPSQQGRIRELMKDYRDLRDKNSPNEAAAALRRELTECFFSLYEAAAWKAMESGLQIPLPVRLFLRFGYLDETLSGRENALILVKLLEKTDSGEAPSGHVHTLFEWLTMVARGEREPSRNTFDQDYATWLRSRKQDGLISEEQEKRYLISPRERMHYELENLFMTGMKMTAGRPAVFCPVLSSHNAVRSLSDLFLAKDRIEAGWEKLRSIDYSLFYRETLFQDPAHIIPRESILLEVLPDLILLPCIGARGGLWQEITGVRRDTPARMFLPVFLNEDPELVLTRLAGQFRWEICKRIQGIRWNDLSELSLTAAYVDYLQFYRKNTDLSSEAKEKVKNEINACRNSFEDVFVLDYIQWIRYESKGTPRLNRVAKNLMFRYCPFSKAVRQDLESNPMYAPLIHRHESRAAKQHRALSAKYKKYGSGTSPLPQEILDHIAYHTL